MKRTLIALSAIGLGLVGAAQAEVQPGELVATSQDATVFAVRGAETLSISVGDQLLAGDRLITSGEGSVTVAFQGCSVDVPASNMVVLGENFCDDAEVGFGAEVLGTDTNLQGSTGIVITVLAAAGIIAGIIIAADNDDDEPTSP